jgi:hypothetical protein
MKNSIILCALVSLLFWGCKTDFDVNAPWKEATVIYGLLDQSKAVQMIKINKAFLGEGDANVFAQNPDSINYDPKDLVVEIFETKNGTTLRTLTFRDSIIAGKESGAFSTQKNIVYVCYDKLDSTDFTKVYKLRVKNLKTGNEASAVTSVLEKVRYTKPNPNTSYVSFVTVASTPTTNGTYSDLATSWTTKPNAKTFQTKLRFVYIERDTLLHVTSEEKFVDWVQLAKQSAGTVGGEAITQNISGQGFYQLLGNEIPENPNFYRVAKRIELTMTVGTEELDNYILINTPSGDLNQDKPTYTNVENGFGIFSSRTSSSITKFICSDVLPPNTNPCNMTTKSIAELVNGKYTYKLKFVPKL